jgi:hypothetical protein
MDVPNRDRAYVPERKLRAYLLSLSHPVGRSKARFFRGLGFDGSTVEKLRDELRGVVQRGEVQETERTTHGTKYVVIGSIRTPSRDEVFVQTVWMIEKEGPDAPRFVTAYPA